MLSAGQNVRIGLAALASSSLGRALPYGASCLVAAAAPFWLPLCWRTRRFFELLLAAAGIGSEAAS
jgi:hypothetical protein